MRKFLSLLLAVALVVSIFSGCSGGGSSASGTEESGGGMVLPQTALPLLFTRISRPWTPTTAV